MKDINEIKLVDSIFTLEEEEQLKLFAQQEANLKYPRRGKRSISKVTYKLSKPSLSTSKTMQKIHSESTSLENKFEQTLIRERISYCKATQLIENVEGNPDFIIPRYRIAIFCDGDFWHGHNFDREKITNNNEFWTAKIERNILRDSEVTYGLKKADWKVFRFWEHEINSDVDACINQIKTYINKNFSEGNHLFTGLLRNRDRR